MIKEVPLKVSMWRAAEILFTVGELLNSTLNDAVNESNESIVSNFEIDVFQFIESTYADQKKSFRSTANLRYNSTSGYTSIKRVISGNSIWIEK